MPQIGTYIQVVKKRPKKTRGFQVSVLLWGEKNGQSFPWRKTRNPYKILVAELMLHRTQAKQVVPVYNFFVKNFSNLSALANARKSSIDSAMKPLGLHWRTALFKKMARKIIRESKGEIPKNRAELLSLPGVGQYIASAVRCFAFNKPEALVDTNTIRLVCRYFGISENDSLRRNKGFQETMNLLLVSQNARAYNYALIDLCHKFCVRSDPLCSSCPLAVDCSYFHIGKPHG